MTPMESAAPDTHAASDPITVAAGDAAPASRPRLFRFALLTGAGFGACFLLAAAVNVGGRVTSSMDQRQIIGTCLLFVLGTTYLLTLQYYQRWFGPRQLRELKDIAPAADFEDACARYQHLSTGTAVVVLIAGLLFGLTQNRFVLEHLNEGGGVSSLDLMFLLGNGVLWAVVALVLVWKLRISVALRRVGRGLELDVYHLERARPIGVLATIDVLAVAGSLAMMPLQALDAEFRLENYQWGLLIGIPSAIALFVLPMLGARARIREVKRERLAELTAARAGIPREDITALELHAAHQHRVQSLPDWPFDVQLLVRVLVYVVLPPLAWIAAALVEQLLDRVT